MMVCHGRMLLDAVIIYHSYWLRNNFCHSLKGKPWSSVFSLLSMAGTRECHSFFSCPKTKCSGKSSFVEQRLILMHSLSGCRNPGSRNLKQLNTEASKDKKPRRICQLSLLYSPGHDATHRTRCFLFSWPKEDNLRQTYPEAILLDNSRSPQPDNWG